MKDDLNTLSLQSLRLSIASLPELAKVKDKTGMVLQALSLGPLQYSGTAQLLATLIERYTGTRLSSGLSEWDLVTIAEEILSQPPAPRTPSLRSPVTTRVTDPPAACKPYPAWLKEAAADIGRPRYELGRVYRGWENRALRDGRPWAIRARRDLEAWLDLHPQPDTEPPGWPSSADTSPTPATQPHHEP